MIKYTAGAMTITLPESFTYEGECVEFSSSSLSAVYGEHAIPGDDAIGFNLSYETSGRGSVVNGITVDSYGEVVVHSGPLDEPEHYESFDDAPFDTYFEPPAEFIAGIAIDYR
ncbi:hypothetical protein LVQ77_04140 [Buttiauxella sp. S04-F03]|uniref:hypothetical protein n=1 Tax=Buttiauxella sp. W03-F01 TaxID=2904524 RepID=UPI001E55A162|nr:hypothetical protein [Buttiauxella sp. W03-F01]MCE0799494.1 hypothetical protein [Buttiauxella sp. W03-F01]